MKKIILSLLALGVFVFSFGQDDVKKHSALGVHFVLNDFNSATLLRTNGLNYLLNSKQWHKTNKMSAGLGISYMKGLTNTLDFAGSLTASFLDYPVPNKPLTGSNDLLLEGATTINMKLVSDKYWFTPFVTAGLGASKFRGYYAAFIPVGLGMQINLYDEAFIVWNSQYRMPVTENAAYHFYHSIGILGSIGKKKMAPPPPVAPPPPPVVEVPKDRDGDGVLDVDDNCPDVAGLRSMHGCPDKDGDGITDADDRCPDVAGLAKYKGCPIPDTDKDGINDEMDKCPAVPGVARYQGCPVPDKDNDGVNDEEDKCPDVAGPASNYGCPVIDKAVVDKINYAAKNIFFATGSAKLLAKSNKSLNEVADLMTKDKSLMLDIDGHTDITGTAAKNQVLSQNRANAVKAYLKSRGVEESRMTATGHGQDQPIADNKTAAGKAKNRRVEMKARNY